MPRAHAAGVGEASREETAGKFGAVGPGAMAIVSPAVAVGCDGLAWVGPQEAATEGAGEPMRVNLAVGRYRNGAHERAAMRFRAERGPRRLMTGDTDEQCLDVVLSAGSS